MRIIIITLLISTFSFAQLEVIGTATLYSALSGAVTYNQIKDRALYKAGDPRWEEYSKRWHSMKFTEIGFCISTGIAVALDSKMELDKFISDMLIVGAIRWVVHDGVYNMAQGNDFFYRSPNTTNILEGFGTWYIKTGILITVILVRYLI